MLLTRRSFLRYCSLAAGAWGMTPADFGLLEKALANPSGPVVLWLLGSACTGCSISLLNRISDRVGEPSSVEDLCADSIRLVFHPTLMASAGETAAAALRQVQEREAYILVVEGAVPMAFGGHACVAYHYQGKDVTFQQAVQEAAVRATKLLCVGTCAAFGGISAAGSNPTQAISVSQLTGRPVVNLSGCPANPDWVVWSIVQLLLGKELALDDDQRPRALYETGFTGATEPALIHDKCPRNPDHHGIPLAKRLGESGHCLENLGCRGPFTKARCEAGWNGVGGARAPHAHPGHWCIGVNAPCHGCVEKSFPGPHSFFEPYVP